MASFVVIHRAGYSMLAVTLSKVHLPLPLPSSPLLLKTLKLSLYPSQALAARCLSTSFAAPNFQWSPPFDPRASPPLPPDDRHANLGHWPPQNHQRPPFNHSLPVDNRPPMDYGSPLVNGSPPPTALGVAPPPGPIDLMALCREGKVKKAVKFLNQGIRPDPPTFFALVASYSDPKFLLAPTRPHHLVPPSTGLHATSPCHLCPPPTRCPHLAPPPGFVRVLHGIIIRRWREKGDGGTLGDSRVLQWHR